MVDLVGWSVSWITHEIWNSGASWSNLEVIKLKWIFWKDYLPAGESVFMNTYQRKISCVHKVLTWQLNPDMLWIQGPIRGVASACTPSGGVAATLRLNHRH